MGHRPKLGSYGKNRIFWPKTEILGPKKRPLWGNCYRLQQRSRERSKLCSLDNLFSPKATIFIYLYIESEMATSIETENSAQWDICWSFLIQSSRASLTVRILRYKLKNKDTEIVQTQPKIHLIPQYLRGHPEKGTFVITSRCDSTKEGKFVSLWRILQTITPS